MFHIFLNVSYFQSDSTNFPKTLEIVINNTFVFDNAVTRGNLSENKFSRPSGPSFYIYF